MYRLPKRIKLMYGLLSDDMFSNNFTTSNAINVCDYLFEASGVDMEEVNMFCLTIGHKHCRFPNFYEVWIDNYLSYDFYMHFRMTRQTNVTLIDALGNVLSRSQYRGGYLPIQLEKKVLICLWYLAKGDTMISIGDRFNVATSTVFNCIDTILQGLCNLTNKYIFWPTAEECIQVSEEFFAACGYPDVIGAIDGCHIDCTIPQGQHDSYQDRRLNHSITLQGISSSSRIFINIFVGFPGSVHDARVLNESGLIRRIQEMGPSKYFFNKYHLLGDSAYPCKSWLMTPYRDTGRLTRQQKRHNYSLSKGRVVIEHVFGQLKGRWAILKHINTYSIKKAVEVITSCCVLHNFCLFVNDDFNDIRNVTPELPDAEDPPAQSDVEQSGLYKRDEICSEM
ncbi:putative nuclease HARBI1 [Anoplophora glabripennis]|uniref:putative nuclease HARBI1 n=1 Tax=Anoplophora glabripennis TaxID=217634 RepID=UPI000873B511|nr:putative nuclease HARBI1 [Anoplophora glabripennis]